MQLFVNEIKILISFFKRPIYNYKHQSLKSKLKCFGIILIVDIILTTIITSLFYALSLLGLNEIFKTNRNLELFNQVPIITLAFLLVVFVPLIEELVFRFHLKYRRWVINILLPIIGLIVIISALNADNIILKISIILISLLALILYVIYNLRITNHLKGIWNRKFNLVFYITTLLFAFMHITNYEFSIYVVLFAPILILPQLVSGFLIGYLRVKVGFIWGIFLHMIVNAILILPIIISLSKAFPSVTIQHKEYNLSIEKVTARQKHYALPIFSKDSISINNYSFKECLGLLLDKEDKFIEFDDSFLTMGLPLLKAEILLHIDYQNQNFGIENTKFTNKQNILNELQNAYNFKLVNQNKMKSQLRLFIKDSLKFKKVSTNLKNGKTEKFYNVNTVSIKNGTIGGLVRGLNKAYKQSDYFFSEINDITYFSIEINKIPLDKLSSYLENHYGLSLLEETREVKITKVIFQ